MRSTLTFLEEVLQTYSLEEIIELNDRTEAEVLHFLVSSEYLYLPDPLPLMEDEDATDPLQRGAS